VPKERIHDVIYFAPFDMEHPVSFNVMEDVGYDKRHLVVAGLMSAFEKIWADAWSARMSYILTNTLFALLEYPDSTLLDINRMLVEKDFRKKVVDNIQDPSIKSFWTEEFAKYSDRYTQEATPAIQNKVGQFVSNPLIRNIIGQPKSSFDIRDIMDNKKILLMNLSKGRIGESNTNLLGSMLITKIYLSAMSRADLSATELSAKPNFYFFVDEFQSFANKSFADILSEARKYKLNLTIAHQYVEQMEEEVRSAVFGNVGTMIVFRVGSFDAEIFEREFAPAFTAEDIVNLGFAQVYLRLMINGIGSKPFSATTLPPIAESETSYRDEVLAGSRKIYARPRDEVEELIKERISPSEKTQTSKQEFSTEHKKTEGVKKYTPIKKEYPHATESKFKKPEHKDAPEKRSFHKAPSSPSGVTEKRPVSQKHIALDSLKKKEEKPFKTENKNQLREALAGVLQQTTSDKQQATDNKRQTPPVPHPPSSRLATGKTAPFNTPTQSPTNKKPEEVPEEVLKKILE